MAEVSWTEKTLHVNDIDMYVIEQGDGPAVVCCHGFPGLSYSWRHQLPAFAAAGFRAIAPDMRGYGRSSRPSDPRAYDRVRTVADMTGLLDALGIDRAVFVGHDFGANLVWDMPRWAPDRVAGIIVVSVPLADRGEIAPSVGAAYIAKQHFLHIHYFQQPGPADDELAAAPAQFLSRVMWALSDADRYLTAWDHPSEGNGYLDVLPPAPELPWPWLTRSEFDHYVAEFTRTGFTGGLNWYRAMDHVWEQGAAVNPEIAVPATFIAGGSDPVLRMFGPEPFALMKQTVADLRGIRLIDGAGHFVQMQEPAQVNEAALEFLSGLRW